MNTDARHVVLGVTGSIGAYKAADLVRRLRDHGCTVTCLLTKEAEHFITPLTLQTLSEQRVYTDLFTLEDPHVIHTRMADRADLLIIAPATANVIGKLAHGLADDMLTCVALATKAKVLLAPAMNVHMYQHAAVQDNLRRLRQLRYHVVGPNLGSLACGYEALGHIADVDEIIRAALPLLGMSAPKSASPASKPRPGASASRSGAQKRRR
ncbi:MAG: hypothetical protein HYY15_00255 [Candidatus Omnitrophica bacterium]|nr:hypothetical protein [Candidatus Omnitrophota bacterium]